MSHECPHCFAELIQIDSFGSLAALRGEEPLRGQIYACPNSEGFEEPEDAITYAMEYENMAREDAALTVEWITCESGTFNGHFYTYTDCHQLHEGYPC